MTTERIDEHSSAALSEAGHDPEASRPGRKVRTTVEIEGVVEEVLVTVPEDEPEVWPAGHEMAVLGKPTPRQDARDKVTGDAKYTQDINLPGMLSMAVLRSPYAHARIASLDTSAAEAHPGVHAVFTHENLPTMPPGAPEGQGAPPLMTPTVYQVGDEVAAVAAVDETTARDALRLIEVEYEQHRFVSDHDRAAEPGAPEVVEGRPNVAERFPQVYERGDLEAGFAEADHVVEMTFRSQYQMHSPLETHSTVAMWKGDQITVWDSTQAVHPERQQLAGYLGMPLANVRVIGLYCGGAFGCKLWSSRQLFLAAIAAKVTGRPVKLAVDRHGEGHTGGNRPGNTMTIRAGCRADGTLTAYHLVNLGGIGVNSAGSGVGSPMRIIYECPNMRTEESSAHINADTARPHRAPGYPQGTFAMEQVIDALAEQCGMDPLEFRLKNYAEDDPIRGRPFSYKGLREAYAKGAEVFGWADREARRGGAGGGGAGHGGHDAHEHNHSKYRLRGFGMATQQWGGAGGPPGYAIVKLYRDGSCIVYSGCQDIGTGTRTTMALVAAEELGLPIDRVHCVMGDTQGTPYGGVSGGSRTTPSQTPAVRMAAAEVKKKLLAAAAAPLELPVEQLDVGDGHVFDTAAPETRKPFAAVIRESYGGDSRDTYNLVGIGWRGPNPDDVTVSTWGVQFAEVLVDPGTGEVDVVRITSAHDIGRVVNPLTAANQVEGGVMQGIGFALYEERVINAESGRIINADLHNYKIPTSFDVPKIDAVFVDHADERANSVGVKGVGEPPIIPTAGAIANAIYDAVGVRVTQSPMTPKRVLDALVKEGRHA